MAVDQLRLWGEAVYRFLQWERERILKRNPSPKEQSEHREALRWLLRGSKLLLILVSDPEFPDRPNVKALGGPNLATGKLLANDLRANA